LELRLPLQSTTGVHCPSGFRRLRSSHRLAPALGSASPEVPRPYDALSPGAPLCHDRPWPTAGDGGFHSPVRCRPRVFSTPRRFQPQHRDELELPRARRSGTATPRSFAALFHAASVPGIPPTELSPPEEPHRLSAAVASLRVRRRPCLRREGPSAVRPVSAALRPPASSKAPREEDVLAAHGRGSVVSPRSSRPPVHPTSCPVKRPRRPTGDLRARRRTAVSPASKLCSPRESVLATDRALPPDSRPKVLSRPTGPVLSWVFAPSEFSPPRPRVRQTATSTRHAEHSRKSKPRSGRLSSRASILRPRPSGTSGGYGWPPIRPADGRCARPRPLTAAPLPLLPFAAPRSRGCPGRSDFRGVKAVAVGRSRLSSRPENTGQLSWGSLPPDASSSF